MNNAKNKYLAVVVGLLLSGKLLASPVIIPNTFVSGTTARAEDMNANFNSVKISVDDNDARINQIIDRLDQLEGQRVGQLPVFLKSNGQNIGIVIGKSTDYTASTEKYDVLSFKEYFFMVSVQSGKLVGSQTIYYAGANCTGQAYIPVDQTQSLTSPRGVYTKYQGEVFGARFSADSIPAYYVKQDTESVSVTPASAAGSDNCTGDKFQHRFKQIDAYPAFPNDPNITGVEDAYVTPIRAGH